jgi:tetratricopeptide (TPR) repeat protein
VNLQAQGMLEESVGPTERSLRLSEEYGPPDDPEVPWGWGSLGYINYQLGHIDEAVGQFEHAVELSRGIFEGDHYDLAHHLNNLGGVYHRMGRLEEAEPILVENLEMNQRMFATEPHGSLSRAYMNLASLYADLGRHAEAARLMEEGYPVSAEALGAEHPRTALHLAATALARERVGNSAGATEAMNTAFRITYEGSGDGSRTHERIVFYRGRLLTLQSSYEAAKIDLVRWLSYNEAQFGRDHHASADAMYWLGRAHLGLQEREGAAALFEEANRIIAAQFGPDHFTAVRAREGLARARQQTP